MDRSPFYSGDEGDEIPGQSRMVICAGLLDSIDAGEEVERFAPEVSFAELTKLGRQYALANRGVDVSLDRVNNFKGTWERFWSVCYKAGWTVDPITGWVDKNEPEPVIDRSLAVNRERDRYAKERKEKKAKAAARLIKKAAPKTGTDTDTVRH